MQKMVLMTQLRQMVVMMTQSQPPQQMYRH
jgi:hypothetical protein